MIHLQSDLTTRQQSDILLELGVPFWTANNYIYNTWHNGHISGTYNIVPWIDHKSWWMAHKNDRYSPSWTTGVLMQILSICVSKSDYSLLIKKNNRILTDTIEYIIHVLKYEIERGEFDFSKLED